MTAMVSIIFGEAQNVVKVPNSALRFQPSMEEMQKIFEKMMAQRNAGREGGADAESTPRQRFAQQGGTPGMGRSAESGRTRQARPRVWMLDEAGELTMVFIRTGVTDNTYTEAIGDNLKEGQEVITGLDSGSSSSRDPRNNMRGGMMFMRR